MSCDDNHEARAKDRAKRHSLPIAGQGVSSTPTYWRSAEERDRKAPVSGAANEFAPGTFDVDAYSKQEGEGQGVSRRGFMQVASLSTAMAAVGACARPHTQKIVPFVRRPEEVTPGNPLHFATAYGLDGYASGLLVVSHEGRPTKIEGNPAHPETLGATTSFEQSLVLSLYDDDRAKQIRSGTRPLAWRTFLAETAVRASQLGQNGGAGLRFLTSPTTSPLLADLRKRILEKFPAAKFVSYASLADDGAVEGAKLAFGKPLFPRNKAATANVILSLDSDFLGEGSEQTRLSREFAARREPGRQMNRLYAVEPAMTITGAMADHRLRLPGSDVGPFLASLISMLASRGIAALAPLASLTHGQRRWDPKWLVAVANDLDRNRGTSLVIVGRRQPAAVHALAAALNVALDNLGKTVEYATPLTADATAGAAPLGTLAQDIATGGVDTLVITASNPVYGAPVDYKLAKLLERVPNSIYHGLYEDETAAACKTVIPAAHPLESWSDLRATDGTTSIVQPLIAPLWGGVQEADVLAAFIGEGDLGAHALLKKYWQGQGKTPADFEGNWERWLADGLVPGTAAPAETGLAVDGAALAQAVAPALGAAKQGMEIAFASDPKVYDGRFANNLWLQELPHPITKLTWENAAMISEATAKALNLEDGDVVEISYRDRRIDAPVMRVPGHADDVVTLPLGYGRTGGEKVAAGVGFNAGALRCSDAPWYDRGVKLEKTERQVQFSITQDHWTMAPDGREAPPPVVEASLAELLNPHSKFHEEIADRRPNPERPQPVIHTPVDYSTQQYKWAMAIDLNKCTGCSACVVACQSENNINTVGKENVRKGREMQWIRIDRYYKGSFEEPDMVTQPLACVHCETAPCEYVCPVNATVHSDEGINEMVYNRCIGTRYCSNNCPYKVRRFNFLNYINDYTAAREMGMNPDVTVRTRGIMEKCTYCVQRIERKRISTRIEGRAIQDGELLTACQQGCPTGAIVFGSLNDSNSKVSQAHADPRRYDLLWEIGTRPRTVYLARVRNPSPELGQPERAGEHE
ncbi:MAG TPA: TAT-variant-translocated molybdopterin oxidoreductase [Polyangia bacterium]|nr:TAT-variant-translocated molybdopterin oxidoreductase [Polyangia bacterium]